MIAGLRRIATSPWLHFVASPQRVPGFAHRRWGPHVVNVLDRLPPRCDCLQHRRYLAALNSGEHPVAGAVPANTDTHDSCPIREHRSTVTASGYAEPQGVSSGPIRLGRGRYTQAVSYEGQRREEIQKANSRTRRWPSAWYLLLAVLDGRTTPSPTQSPTQAQYDLQFVTRSSFANPSATRTYRS